MKVFFLMFILFFYSAAVFPNEKENAKISTDQKTESKSENSEKPKHYFGSKNGQIKKRLVSFNMDYLLLGMKHQGLGFGINFEQYFAHHVAGKISFGHSLFRLENSDWCPTVSFGMFAEVYPFADGLNGLYASLGGYFDYIAFDPDDYDSKGSKNFVSIFPLVGYKVRVCSFLSLDINAGYKLILFDEGDIVYNLYKDYIINGMKFGISLKLHPFK